MSARSIIALIVAAAAFPGLLGAAAPPSVDPDSETRQSTDPTPRANVCVFGMAGDRVHRSATPPSTASAHAWWTNIVGCAGRKAVVTTQLQRKSGSTWTNVGSRGVKTVWAGGGSANRTVTRYTCTGSAKKTYRHWVDVDVLGMADPSNKHTSAPVVLACG
ncbi:MULTISPECIES: hypothetical protein [unclassified Curtobacterium]|uniref:hypothetical protein n=1 Tax=unclassified Curtobacterium TaxID=257496 RepID=UPI00381898CE